VGCVADMGGALAVRFEDDVNEDDELVLDGMILLCFDIYNIYFFFLLLLLITGSLSFNECSGSKGNYIYLEGMDLKTIVTKNSFHYDYSLINENDLIGKNRETNEEVHLRYYLCPLRTPDTNEEERMFDCDEGCVEYYV
jgi:hypothetical protein